MTRKGSYDYCNYDSLFLGVCLGTVGSFRAHEDSGVQIIKLLDIFGYER